MSTSPSSVPTPPAPAAPGAPVSVSVVVIFLNGERFLAEALDSVFAQTLDAWELILVNDGSTDRSGEIARHYASRDPARVRCVEHPGGRNRGMSASRNLGIAHASGEFLAFLDADDVWLPEKLERQRELLLAHPRAAMVYGPTELWYGWTGRAEDARRDRLRLLGVRPDRLMHPPQLIPRFLRDRALPPSTCGILVRTEAARRVGGFEESFRGMYEDQAFLYKLCLREPVYVTARCWDRYRQHGGSSTALAEASGWYDGNGPSEAHRQFLDWFEHHATVAGSMTRPIRRALLGARRPYTHPRLAWLQRRLSRAVAKRLRWLRVPGRA